MDEYKLLNIYSNINKYLLVLNQNTGTLETLDLKLIVVFFLIKACGILLNVIEKLQIFIANNGDYITL